MSGLSDIDDVALVARLHEHVAGDDHVQGLLYEISARLLLHRAFVARARWVLAALLHEASKVDGHDEEAHAMLLEQLDAAGPG